MKDPADQRLDDDDDIITSSTESHNSDNDSLNLEQQQTPSTTPPYASPSAMLIDDDVSNPLATFSPQSTASSSTTPPPPPPESAAQEAFIAQLRSQARRPGLGVGESHPQVLQPFTLSPSEARVQLGFKADGDFICKNLHGGETVMVLEFSTYLKIKNWLAEGEESTLHVVVNNTSLFELYESVERPGRLREGLEEGRDYVLISEKSWALLIEWFGGGPSITRRCVNDNGKMSIDLRGIELKCKRSSKPHKFLRFVFSQYDTVGTVKRTVVEEWAESYNGNGDTTLYRLWDYFNDRCYARLQPDSSQLIKFRLRDNQSIMFEEADPVTRDFPWDPDTGEPLYSAPAASSTMTSTYWDNNRTYTRKRAENQVMSSHTPISPGVVGLSNLGNTCFMNSTLQCLNHVWMLRKHFTSDDYLQEINETNPLGTGGKLAKSFGELMKLMWSNEGDVISPAGFKSQMAEFKPEFSGYQQHDSQELLSFLLDGLHEDLNRIKQKPVTTAVEGNGKPDAEVAAECKHVHRLRNDSIVNDLFEGFYRSTLVCPDCHKKSVTFDPFSVIQLPVSKPLRGGEGKLVPVHVTLLDSATALPPPTSLQSTTLRLPVDSFLYEVRSRVETPEKDAVVLCKVRQGRIEKLLRDTDEKDKYSKDDQIIAFQHPLASKFRTKQELLANSAWHRPLQSEEPHNETTASLPLAKGTVWIGSADNHNIRMRLEVVEQGDYGMWEQGLGYKLKCIVDISPVANTSYDKNEGVEEYAYEVEGVLVSSAKATAELGRSAFKGKFDTTQAAQSFGSYVGRFPRHDQNKNYEFQLTCSLEGDFVSGKFTEQQQQQQYRYSSSYNTSQAFALQRVESHTDLVTIAELGEIGPPSEPRARDAPFPVTLFHRYVYDNISQPMLLLLDSNKQLSPKQLYDMVVEVLTRRIRLRNTKSALVEDNNEKDPFGLLDLFTLTVPKHAQVKLEREDDSANLFILHREVLSVCIDWAYDKLPKQSPLYRALFSLLYSEERDGAGAQTRGNTLGDCFDLFSEEEKLTPSEAWYCSSCKEHKEAFKRMEIWDLSDMLVIQMKRFSQSQSSYSFDKDDSEVDFPLEGLDLNKRVLGGDGSSYVYDLVAVSHHYGGLGGGHYVAHARDEKDGAWYELDDSNVRLLGDCEAAAPKIKKSSAYVLFYAKRDKTPESWRKTTSAL